MADYPVMNAADVRAAQTVPVDMSMLDRSNIPDFALSLRDDDPAGRATAICSKTPEQLTDEYMASVRQNPAVRYYVDRAGSDSNNGSENSPFQSPGMAQYAVNQVAQGGQIMVKAANTTADYNNNINFRGGNATMRPAVPTIVVPYGGIAKISTHTDFAVPSLDGVFTRSYVLPSVAAGSVVNRMEINGVALYKESVFVPLAAYAERPGTWTSSAGNTIVAPRLDGNPVTNDNTRVYLTATRNLRMDNAVPPYAILPATARDSMWFEGGCGTNGSIDLTIQNSVTSTAASCFIANRVRSHVYGGLAGSGRGFSIDGINGLVALFDSFSGASRTDSFNSTITRGQGPGATGGVPVKQFMLLVNCTSFDAGRPGLNSNNHPTVHNDGQLIDAGGHHLLASGGAFRSVGASKSLLAGSLYSDRGDKYLNPGLNLLDPTAVRVDDTAQAWCFRTKIEPGSVWDYYNNGGGIYTREVYPSEGARFGIIQEY